jgi:hypothetical protein
MCSWFKLRAKVQGCLWRNYETPKVQPLFTEALICFQAVEQLHVQQSITKLAVEAFVKSVLPRSLLFYEERRLTNLAIRQLIGPLSQR